MESTDCEGSKSLEGTTFRNVYCKKGNKNTKSLVYTSPARPILKYVAACWDPYRECQISALDRVQNIGRPAGIHTGNVR